MTAVTADAAPLASPSAGRSRGLLAVGRMIGEDLLSTLVYAGLYAATHALAVSTAVAVGAGLAGIAWRRWRGRPVDGLQLMSVALVVVFGGAGLLLHDARFVMIKPTLIYLAVAAVMLKPGWMARYMPPVVCEHGADVVRNFERVWSGCMALTAVANAALALHGDVRAWTAFIAVAPVASKAALTAVQYGVLRVVVRRRVRRARA